MPNIKLNWDYSENDPLPETVEVYRDGVVIHTENNPITEFTDSVLYNKENNGSFTYKVKSIKGDLFRFSDPVVVSFESFESFESFDDYEYYYKFDGAVLDLVNPIPSISCSNPVFGSFGIDLSRSSLISAYVQHNLNPEYLLNSPTFTVEVKIKAGEQQTDYQSIFELSQGDNSGWALRCDNTSNCIYFSMGGLIYDSSIPVLDNEPHKIAVSASNGELRIYIDDVLDKTHTFNPTTRTYGYIYVGLRIFNGEKFKGEIKDFGISLKSLYD